MGNGVVHIRRWIYSCMRVSPGNDRTDSVKALAHDSRRPCPSYDFNVASTWDGETQVRRLGRFRTFRKAVKVGWGIRVADSKRIVCRRIQTDEARYATLHHDLAGVSLRRRHAQRNSEQPTRLSCPAVVVGNRAWDESSSLVLDQETNQWEEVQNTIYKEL